MVTKTSPEHELPLPDDGWWASVLAEDETREPLPRPLLQDEPRKAALGLDWERATHVYRQDEIVALQVVACNRGGLLVEGAGLSGFIPCSHLIDLPAQLDENQREDCLSAYLGRTLNLKIIECIPEEGRLIFSERAARAAAGKRTEIFVSLQPGQRVAGEVTNITDFGVFVDLGGVEGLIHISELSWGRVTHPGQILQVGQRVEVLVLEIAPERCRIALSLKRLLPNPWETAQTRYPVNAIVPAVITSLVPFGAFARLEEGLEGLIHTSEIPMPANVPLKTFLTTGQSIRVRVLQVDAARQRLGLSMRFDH